MRRPAKSGFVTRRSASESNSRSPMYFPEVDVDVRPRPRSDEPDFSHIKSTEDISSGYSSADNSASLTRTASLGAAARARSRTTRTTTVTTIKRPQAAEESEVIIEELRDDDNNVEYANMPHLVNVPSPIFLSHTEPPFLYQYVGDEVKIIKVLGDFPLSTNDNLNTCKKIENYAVTKAIEHDKNVPETIVLIKNNSNINQNEINTHTSKIEDSNIQKNSNVETSKKVTEPSVTPENIGKDHIDTTSLDASINDNDSADSDDEASFGTPDNSPRSRRKTSKGRYGKAKAPLPPNTELSAMEMKNKTDTKILESGTSQESLVDIVHNSAFEETGNFKGIQVVNPIAENNIRHRSKSPGIHTKTNSSSGISRLLQLPGKLAFWHKGDDKSTKSDASNSSDHSRRSSNADQSIGELHSCLDLAKQSLTSEFDVSDANVVNDKTYQEVSDYDGESVSQEIIEKSSALQKTIEAKLERHPEYKTVPLHDQMPSTSKSTDV